MKEYEKVENWVKLLIVKDLINGSRVL